MKPQDSTFMHSMVRPVTALVLAAGIILSACEEELLPAIGDSVMIGTQEWMTRSLDVDTFQNGDTIQEARSDEEWHAADQERRPAWCYYGNDPDNGPLYGRLYNYYAVTDPRGLAPDGWHIPTKIEWQAMLEYLGANAAEKLKWPLLWASDGGGNNSSGFSAMPGSFRGTRRNLSTYPPAGAGYEVVFWTSSRRCYRISSTVFDFWVILGDEGSIGAYIRCVKGPSSQTIVSNDEQSWAARDHYMDTIRNGDVILNAPPKDILP